MSQAETDLIIPRPEKSDEFRKFYDSTHLDIHNIQQMVEAASRASMSLMGTQDDSGMWQLPADDANLLHFAILDLEKRVRDLQEKIEGC
jgi:hypothetical protein